MTSRSQNDGNVHEASHSVKIPVIIDQSGSKTCKTSNFCHIKKLIVGFKIPDLVCLDWLTPPMFTNFRKGWKRSIQNKSQHGYTQICGPKSSLKQKRALSKTKLFASSTKAKGFTSVWFASKTPLFNNLGDKSRQILL